MASHHSNAEPENVSPESQNDQCNTTAVTSFQVEQQSSSSSWAIMNLTSGSGASSTLATTIRHEDHFFHLFKVCLSAYCFQLTSKQYADKHTLNKWKKWSSCLIV